MSMFDICKEYRELELRAHWKMEQWTQSFADDTLPARREIEGALVEMLTRRSELNDICREQTGNDIEAFIEGMRRLLAPADEPM